MSDTALLDTTSTAKKPAKTFRSRGVSAAVFTNRSTVRGREVDFHKVSLQRTYKDGDQFKTTSSLSRDDLPLAQFVLGQAWAWILTEEAKQKPAKV